MKITMKVEREFDVKLLKVDAGVRYWDDAKVNGEYDTNCEDSENPNGSPTIPCAEYIRDRKRVLRGSNWRWRPVIDIESGQITNWTKGISANVHYKVCDDGIYTLLDSEGNGIIVIDGYVPEIMCPADAGYGDYIIMDIDENGFIQGWNKKLIKELIKEEED